MTSIGAKRQLSDADESLNCSGVSTVCWSPQSGGIGQDVSDCSKGSYGPKRARFDVCEGTGYEETSAVTGTMDLSESYHAAPDGSPACMPGTVAHMNSWGAQSIQSAMPDTSQADQMDASDEGTMMDFQPLKRTWSAPELKALDGAETRATWQAYQASGSATNLTAAAFLSHQDHWLM